MKKMCVCGVIFEIGVYSIRFQQSFHDLDCLWDVHMGRRPMPKPRTQSEINGEQPKYGVSPVKAMVQAIHAIKVQQDYIEDVLDLYPDGGS